MSMTGAFQRCRAVRGKDVPLAMSRWWAKQKPADAEITMHLAANEQSILVPWVKTFPKKVADRVTTYVWPIGAISLIYGTIVWADWADGVEDYHHRF